jgi:hypothetical protein
MQLRSLLPVLALVLAGCASTSGPDDSIPAPIVDPDWAVAAIFGKGVDPDDTDRIPDHDHEDRELHMGLSTPNFEVLGHDPLPSDYFNGAAGTTYCGDASSEGERKLAVVHSFATDVALIVIDVTDHAKPTRLGELVLPYDFTYDVAIFADGKYAVLAGNPDLKVDGEGPPADDFAALFTPPAEGRVPFHPVWRDACGNERTMQAPTDSIPHGYSAILVDLSDPMTPTVADFYEYPAGRNVHSISTAIIDGMHYVATSGLMAVPCTLPSISGNPSPVSNPIPCEPQVPRFGNALSHFDILTVNETPAGARLVLHEIYTPTDQTHLDPSLLYLSNGHTDATIEKHPVTNQTLAYLADWDGGLHIIRLDGVGQASPVASWGAAPGGDTTQMKGHIHSVVPVAGLREGKHLLVVGQEVIGRPAGRPSGQVAILDITNPGTPLRVAKWTLPVDVAWGPALGEAYSTHYPILVNDTLFTAMYHAGVWAADFSKASRPDLPSVGAFLPDGETAGDPYAGGMVPEVLEVLSLGGNDLLIFDGTSGAYTVRWHGPSADVPPAAPWADNPWIG